MKVKLLKTVATLGQSGSIINVSDGYAVNYLLPQKIATSRLVETTKTEPEKLVVISSQNKNDLQKVSTLQIEIKALANDKGSLYEAIKPGQVAQIIRQKKNINVSAKQISFNKHVKELGEHEALFKIANQVVKFKLTVTKL